MFSFPKISLIFKTSIFCSFLALSFSSCSSLQDTSADTVSTQTLNSNSSKDVIDWERPFGVEVGKSSWLDLKQKLNELGVDTKNIQVAKSTAFSRGVITNLPNWKIKALSLKSVKNPSKFEELIVSIDEKNIIHRMVIKSNEFNTYSENLAVIKKRYSKQFSSLPKNNSFFSNSYYENLFLKQGDDIFIEVNQYFTNLQLKNYLTLKYELEGELNSIPQDFQFQLSPLGFTSKYGFDILNTIKNKHWIEKNNRVYLAITSPKYEQAFELAFCQKLQDPNTSADEKAVLKKSLVGYCKK